MHSPANAAITNMVGEARFKWFFGMGSFLTVDSLYAHYGKAIKDILLGAHGLQLRLGKSGTETLLQSKSELAANEWSHIAAIKNGNEVMIYINGELDTKGETGQTTVDNEQNLFIGKRPQFANEGIEDAVDEIRIWRKVLSEEDIRKYTEMGKEQFIAVSANVKHTVTWGKVKKLLG